MRYDIEPREMFYNRTGQLSQITGLNKEVAEQFMQITDLRRDIIIEDSGKEPAKDDVAVGSDVLAWRSMLSLSELTKVVHRSRKFHQVETIGHQHRLLIHDRLIDSDIKQEGYQDPEDYNRKCLARLRKEAKDGASEILWREKMGWREQMPNWMVYMVAASFLLFNLSRNDYLNVGLDLGATIGILHPLFNFRRNQQFLDWQNLQRFARTFIPDSNYDVTIPPYITPKSWQKAFYPLLPVDKWIQGRVFLAQHGEELIIPRG